MLQQLQGEIVKQRESNEKEIKTVKEETQQEIKMQKVRFYINKTLTFINSFFISQSIIERLSEERDVILTDLYSLKE